MTLGWHFTSGTIRDGRPLPEVGEWLEHDGLIEMCASGLHASKRLIDALQYAPGEIVSRVELVGDLQHGDDKMVGRRRKVLWRADITDTLRLFAGRCALDVLHLWDPPEVVVQYLKTGDESIRAAAWVAARAAAWAAAWAASGATGDAARAAFWAAARAAGAASWAASWAAAGATGAAARGASGATGAAARGASGAAARKKQNRRLTAMISRLQYHPTE